MGKHSKPQKYNKAVAALIVFFYLLGLGTGYVIAG